MLRDALKRHPCRIGLNRASMHGFPWYTHSAKKLPPKTKHGKPGQAIPLPPPCKDLPPVLGKKEKRYVTLHF